MYNGQTKESYVMDAKMKLTEVIRVCGLLHHLCEQIVSSEEFQNPQWSISVERHSFMIIWNIYSLLHGDYTPGLRSEVQSAM